MKNSFIRLACAVLLTVLAVGTAGAFEHSSLYDDFVNVDALDGEADGDASLLTARLCEACHEAETDEVMQSVHYTLRSGNKRIDYPGGGSHGHYDRSSGITGGNTVINYTFPSERGCGRCHVGKYLPGSMNEIDIATGLPTANMAIVRNGIDCLICHAKVYNGRDHLVEEETGDGRTVSYWKQDRTWASVESIGPTTTENCLRCHREPASPDERGTPFEPWSDVHIASEEFQKGNACTKCHAVKQHRMVRGNYITEIFASDYEVGSPENELECEGCHGDMPHRHKEALQLNEHTAVIACQTCHIPWTSGVTYSTWEDDGTNLRFSRQDTYSALDTRPYISEGKSEKETWEEYRIRPKYLWFNGRASYLAQPFGSRSDPGSKIWPFKPLSSGLAIDVSGLRMVDLLDDATIQRAMVGTGAMIPGDAPEATAGTGIGTVGNRTTDSSLSAEQQLEMYASPLLFNVDLTVLKETSSLALAINSAMAKTIYSLNTVGRILGAETDTPLLGIFDGGYPGNGYVVVKVPTGENMQAALGPNYPSASYLTLSHGVRGARESLGCTDCHGMRGIFSNNRFLVFSGRDDYGLPLFREVSNWKVLGYGDRGPYMGRKHHAMGR
ncbi:MAG: hypothetical protein GXO94_09770 [Nitrospirae bacterium]|nr:hypothetical protein [Nitrospirota bacterium]